MVKQQLSIILVVVLMVEMNPNCIISACNGGCWTEWFDRDDPDGTGDYERLSSLLDEYPNEICQNPLQIEAETLSGQTVSQTGDVIMAFDTTDGFLCVNNDQSSGRCQDYRVRFKCPSDFCDDVCWTGWYDRDDPTGRGDMETLSELRDDDPGICQSPFFIEVVTASTGTPFASTGETAFVNNPTDGFICLNKDQADKRCLDYKVRFGCPCNS